MKFESEIREQLVENTIHLVAEGGFEKATTRAIICNQHPDINIKLNEVYIYRLFGSKEELYAEAFSKLDNELIGEVARYMVEFRNSSDSVQKKFNLLFMHLWRFLMRNEDYCRCYVRYYYSVYFTGESLQKHNQFFDKVVVKFKPLFKNEADVSSLIHYAFLTMLDFAIRVYNGDLEDSQTNATHIFNVLYVSLASYFKVH